MMKNQATNDEQSKQDSVPAKPEAAASLTQDSVTSTQKPSAFEEFDLDDIEVIESKVFA